MIDRVRAISDAHDRAEMIDREKRPWRYDRGAVIPPPRTTCGEAGCDAGWLWHEDRGAVVVMRCPCQSY